MTTINVGVMEFVNPDGSTRFGVFAHTKRETRWMTHVTTREAAEVQAVQVANIVSLAGDAVCVNLTSGIPA